MTMDEFFRGIAILSGRSAGEALDKSIAQKYTQMKGEPMAKAEEQLLPKDLLEDLESGDRSNEFLEISRNDQVTGINPGSSLGSMFGNAQWQNNQLAQGFGSSWAAASATLLGKQVAGGMIRFK